MANILGIGIAAVDIINSVESYPLEDSEVRASSHRTTCGGNAANTLMVLGQLGHNCSLGAVLTQDQDGALIESILKSNKIAQHLVHFQSIQTH